MLSFASTPPNGSISDAGPTVQTYDAGPFLVANQSPVGLGQVDSGPRCDEPGFECDTYTLTTNISNTYLSTHANASIKVTMYWTDLGAGQSDYDLYIYDGTSTPVDGNHPAPYQSASGANPEVASIFPLAAGPQTYSIKIVPYQTTHETVHVRIELVDGIPGGSGGTSFGGPDPVAPGVPRFMNFYAPRGSTAEAFSGEFNIGYNRTTHRMMLMNSGPVWRLTPAEVLNAANPECCKGLWEDETYPPTIAGLDPILWTDNWSSPGALAGATTGARTFTSNSTAGTNASYGYTDNDGAIWNPINGATPNASSDHQTIGSGPYPNISPYNLTSSGVAFSDPNNPVTHGHAVYYCAQTYPVGAAACQRSDTLGSSFGPTSIIYNPNSANVPFPSPTPAGVPPTGTTCSGIHGHVHVGPNGYVYVPVRDCGGNAGLVFSTDGGVSWSERVVPNSKVQPHGSDPTIAIGSQNRIYFFYVAANSDGTEGHIFATTSENITSPTPTWTAPVDLGASHGIKNAVFPEATAASFGPDVQPADDDRAAVGFVGTNQAGNYEGPTFPGVWYLFIATTYDHGQTWHVVNATPNDPVQGQIGIWQGGGSNANRNLLDFNEVTYDEKGRILFGYDDGCLDDCVASPTAANATYGAAMRVARQTGGKSLMSAFDSETDTTTAKAAKAPCLSGTRDQDGSHLEWVAPDNGGSEIAGYKVYRGTSSNGETLLFTTTNPSTKITDAGAPEGGTLYYKVQAVTAAGDGALSNETALISTVSGNSCVFPYKQVGGAGQPDVVGDPDPTGGELTIEHVNVGEPFVDCLDNSLTFIMKVATLDPTGTGQPVLPPNSAWQILFGVTDTNGNPETVFVSLDTFTATNTPVTPRVSLGRRDPGSATNGTVDTRTCTNSLTTTCPIISATYAADGTITIKLNAANPISFPAPGTTAVGVPFTWNASGIGTQLKSISGNTLVLAGVQAGFLETASQTAGGNYIRVGNASCSSAIPVAALTATPQSGKAPLAVSFNGTASSEPAGACATINSYAIDYGDGSTAQNGTGLFSHTYSLAGTYNARLTVSDTAGKTSSNTAQQLITVNEAGKPDLIVSALTSSIKQPAVGTTATLTATVKNQGAGSAGVSQTQFLDGKTSLGVVYTSSLAPGASTQVSLNWTPTIKGKHTIQATADANKAVVESKETNNSKSITVSVR